MSTEYRRPLDLGTAATMQLLALFQSYSAAIMRDDLDEAERLRREAHDVLDARLDLAAQAVTAVKSILNP